MEKIIWIVDDDASIRFVLEKTLKRQFLKTISFDSAQQAWFAFEQAYKDNQETQSEQSSQLPDLIISDIRMPSVSGLTLLERIRTFCPQLPVIIMTAYSDLDSAVSAYQGGAFEYLAKPFDIEHVQDLVIKALQSSQFQRTADTQNISLDYQSLGDGSHKGDEMLGQAPSMQVIFRSIGRLSQSHASVLITGESGTGKELVARALHKHSPRSHAPFIAINTAAIAPDLLESELFGHEKGAFTGAHALKRGLFEQAHGGTLFLDEIGDMPFVLQTRLLRVLSDASFYRVGGNNLLKTNVRIIAATHQNLEQRVVQGLFREDLFYRLNVIRLEIPSLRERTSDIAHLARYFLAKSAQSLGVAMRELTPEAIEILENFSYPGNVRQLQNICHWLTIMTPSVVIEPKDLPHEVLQNQKEIEPIEPSDTAKTLQIPVDNSNKLRDINTLNDLFDVKWRYLLAQEVKQQLVNNAPDIWNNFQNAFEQTLVETAIAHHAGKRAQAALALGIGRNTLTRKLQQLGLNDAPLGEEP